MSLTSSSCGNPSSSAATTQATLAASSSAPTTSAPTSSVLVSASTSLPSSVQGVSAVITHIAKNLCRIVGHVYQAVQPYVPQYVGSSSQGLAHNSSTTPALSSSAAMRPPTTVTQSSGVFVVPLKSSVSNMQNQVAPKLEHKASDPVKPAGQPINHHRHNLLNSKKKKKKLVNPCSHCLRHNKNISQLYKCHSLLH